MISNVYTQISVKLQNGEMRLWVLCGPPHLPWLAVLHEFHDDLIALDLLHVLHLGVMRDLLGTGFKLICRNRDYYSGSSIEKRLRQLTSDLKQWCRANGQTLSLNKIHKNTLLWRGDMCPELKVKGADCLVCLRFLNCKLQEQPPTSYPGIVACVWFLERFIGCLAHGSIFLTPEESETAYVTGVMFIRSYLALAQESLMVPELLFKTRPKLHFLLHLVEDMKAKTCIRNPFYDSTFVDEDWVKHALALKKRMSFRTCSLDILKRFAVMNKASLNALLENRPSLEVAAAAGCGCCLWRMSDSGEFALNPKPFFPVNLL